MFLHALRRISRALVFKTFYDSFNSFFRAWRKLALSINSDIAPGTWPSCMTRASTKLADKVRAVGWSMSHEWVFCETGKNTLNFLEKERVFERVLEKNILLDLIWRRDRSGPIAVTDPASSSVTTVSLGRQASYTGVLSTSARISSNQSIGRSITCFAKETTNSLVRNLQFCRWNLTHRHVFSKLTHRETFVSSDN